jgi:hypothetical protein
VTEYKLGEDNAVVQGDTFKHTILLSGVFGDSPAMKKLARWLSHAAYFGCGFCMMRGTKVGGGGMYFLGYAHPTSYGPFAPNEREGYGAHSEHAVGWGLCGDAAMRLSDAFQRCRADVVDRGERLPTDVGCHGRSIFVKHLSYVDYNNLFVVPIAHAGLLGVVKDFWTHVLAATPRGEQAQWYSISSEARRVMASREAGPVSTCDFGRSYTDITTKKGNWVMEDWLHWAEVWSVFVLRPYIVDGVEKTILHPDAAEMWQHLRQGLLYFCRSYPIEGVAQTVDEAAAELREYAVLVEDRFGPRMCKYNLHLLVCRLAEQEAARGRVAHCTEYWLENLIQWAKSTLRYRTTKFPELVLANDMLVDDAIVRSTAKFADVRAKLGEWQHMDGGSTHRCPDDGGCDGSQLLGPGVVLGNADRVTCGVDAIVQQFVAEYKPAGWAEGMVGQASIWQYKYAHAGGTELLHSTSYKRPRSRVSYNVLCQFWEGEVYEGVDGVAAECPTDYIGKIKFFLKVVAPVEMGSDAADAEVLRLAVMDLHLVQWVESAVGGFYQCSAYEAGTPCFRDYAMSLSQQEGDWGSLCYKLAMGSDGNVAIFLPYSNMSASGQDD